MSNAATARPKHNLKSKLETMGGAVPEEDGDDQMRIMSGRASLSEFSKASLSKREQDEPKGDYELNEEDQGKLDEDSRYLLHDKLDGAAPIGKPKRLHEGEEMMADQEIYNWYSAVTGVALSRNMKLAMAPEKPNNGPQRSRRSHKPPENCLQEAPERLPRDPIRHP